MTKKVLIVIIFGDFLKFGLFQDSGSVHSIPIDALPVRYCKIRTSKRPDEKVGFTLAGSKLNPGVHKVINLVRNSPAAASGLRDEDYLIEVSGVPVQHMNYFDVIDLIREKKIEDDLELMVADAATAQSYKSKAQPMHF